MGLRDRLTRKLMPEGGSSVEEALALLSRGAALVDIRTLAEYEAGHAPGARLVDVKRLADDPFTAVFGDDPLAEPDTPVVLVCDTGLRSGHAVRLLTEKDMKATFITGGLRAWAAAGQVLLPGPPRNRR